MSYLVLARKHRPATFNEVVGQEHISKTLAGALASGRLAHAFCFTGPRGVGKTSVARILAKALNCEQGPTENPCGKCVHCREIEEGRSVDVQEIDAASNSRVEDVRELREMIRYRPQSARYRITILDEVHMLSKAAFNALLKTLEEPPEHAVFILATTDVHKVPLTILSRCQRYDFRRLPPKTLAAHLGKILEAEGFALPPESLALMAREADGSVRDSLSLLDQVLSAGEDGMSHAQVVELLGLVDRELVAQTAEAVLAGDAGRVLDLVAQVYAAGGEMQAFYAALQEHFRNLAAAKAAPPDAELFGLTDEELGILREQAASASPETLHEIFDHLARAEDLFRRASQPRLVMEMTLLKLTSIKPVLSLQEVIRGLGAAIAAGGGAPPPPPSPARPPRTAPPASAAPGGPAPGSQASGQTPAQVPPGARRISSPQAALEEVSEYMSRDEMMLASFMSRGRAAFADGIFTVTLDDNPAVRPLCNQENEVKLARFLNELFVGIKGASLVAAPLDPEKQAKLKQRQETEAKAAQALLKDPVVMEALDVFEAKIADLKPAAPQAE